MRVLFVSVADPSVYRSCVPLAWALRTAGHEVRFAVPPAFTGVVTADGLTAVPVGGARDTRRMTGLHPQEQEAMREGLPQPYRACTTPDADGSWEAMRDGYTDLLTRWHKPDNFPMIADLVAFARSWRPDLVLWEPTTYAAPIAARACGAAHGRLLWSLDVFWQTYQAYRRLQPDADPLADWLGGYARRHGGDFAEDLIAGQFTVDPLPDSLRFGTDLRRVPLRYTPYGGPARLPDWLRRSPERPRVALTLGVTATQRFAGYVLDVRDTLDALAGLDADVVATVADPDRVGPVAGNVRLVPWVPLEALVATCDVVVDHAGPGTLLTAALAGVPQLTVPWDFDEPALAARAARQGAALNLPAGEATGPRVRDGVLRLLREPAFRDRAAALRAELHAMPTANQVARQLEAMTLEHRMAVA
jgi:glycosyltransferase (activator-dependent family)